MTSPEMDAMLAQANASQAQALANIALTQEQLVLAQQAALQAQNAAQEGVNLALGDVTEILGTGLPPHLQQPALNATYPSAVIARQSPLGFVTYTDLQAAADQAAVSGKMLWAEGLCQTDQTLNLKCNGDLSRLQVEYTGTGTSVRVGEAASLTHRLSLKLPYTRNMNKAGKGWLSVAGSVGIELVNLNSCYDIHVPGARNFAVGLLDRGTSGRGHVYNTVTIGSLENNERNHVLRSEGTGWANENVYIGGRWSHYSGEGTKVPGCKHIHLEAADSNGINNNLWIRPAIEGDAPEFTLDCNGMYNTWLSARWEASMGATVRWGTGATYNTISGGYATYRIKADISFKNLITAPHRHDLFGAGVAGSVQFGSSSSSHHPAWQILDTKNGVTENDWSWRASASGGIMGRRSAEQFPRIVLDNLDGALRLGNGVAEPQSSIRQYGTGSTLMVGASLRFPDGDKDIGSSTLAPKDVYVGNHIRLGSLYLRDNGGALQVSANGTTWKAVTIAP